jgi:lambda family phage minor tail protein L
MPVPTAAIQGLNPGSIIELFVLDATGIAGGALSRFHAGTNQVSTDVVWQGNTYTAFPVKAEGFEITSKGTLPRPTMTISNVGGVIGLLVRDLEDLVGAVVTRKRTLVQYLDAVNFVGGLNPTADPTQEYEDDVYLVERKVSEDKETIVFELASALDIHGLKLPSRLIQATVCPWNDAAICTYSVGGVCDKTIEGAAGCKFHWGATAVLPFGGFPGTSRIR